MVSLESVEKNSIVHNLKIYNIKPLLPLLCSGFCTTFSILSQEAGRSHSPSPLMELLHNLLRVPNCDLVMQFFSDFFEPHSHR